MSPADELRAGAVTGRWTPDTARVREWYATWPTTTIDTRVVPEYLAEFDRWLAAHDREVAARALREAELAIPPFMGIDNLRRWLIQRADRMTRAER